MTKDEIKRELDALGISYQKDAKIADLEALYAPYHPDAHPDDTIPTPPASDETQVAPAEGAPEAERDNRTVSVLTDVNVREDPSMDARVLCVAKQGAVLAIGDGDADGWTPIILQAWVKSEFLAYRTKSVSEANPLSRDIWSHDGTHSR